jgi:hypothetical protein
VQFLGDLMVVIIGCLKGEDATTLLGSMKQLDERTGAELGIYEFIGILHALHRGE